MLFNSYTFVIFFCTVLLVYYSLKSWTLRKGTLLVASYLFYAAWNPPFVLLLWLSTVVDWFAGRNLFGAASVSKKKFWLAVSLTANLGLLGFFKYGAFLLESFKDVVSLFGIAYAPPDFSIVLPVGISFYTFQTLSYTLDIYRGRAKPWHSFLDYSLYVTFFPQLVAGPIVRAGDFLPQCREAKHFSAGMFGTGWTMIVVGLFQKVVIADSLLAPVVEKLFGSSAFPGLASAWAGTLAFSGQIYCDFAGYTNCAIGVAQCLGFVLPVNFRSPYAALGLSDFWNRWHITLSTWLRDYLYIGLGGNRRGLLRTVRNLFVTMFLGGLWHGASWTFVVWGVLHGFLLAGEHTIRKMTGTQTRSPGFWKRVVPALVTFVCVSSLWAFFRAPSLEQGWIIFSTLFGGIRGTGDILSLPDYLTTIVVVGTIFAVQNACRRFTLAELISLLPSWAVTAGIIICLYAIGTMHADSSTFIYFQF